VISPRAALAGALFAGLNARLAAQDTTALVQASPRPTHVLAIDATRLQPFQRSFDVSVVRGDSTIVIGERDVSFAPASYANTPAWLLVESRTGLVPAAESLYLSTDMRLLHWSSTLGLARMTLEFGADSIYGVAAAPGGRHNIVISTRSDLVVSLAMIEALLPTVPLDTEWTDSVGVLSVDRATTAIVPGTLSVIGEEEIVLDSLSVRPNWVVALKTEARNVLFWVDKETGTVRRIQQDAPSHVGRIVEIRARLSPTLRNR
jgi:hypothetical protein